MNELPTRIMWTASHWNLKGWLWKRWPWIVHLVITLNLKYLYLFYFSNVKLHSFPNNTPHQICMDLWRKVGKHCYLTWLAGMSELVVYFETLVETQSRRNQNFSCWMPTAWFEDFVSNLFLQELITVSSDKKKCKLDISPHIKWVRFM